MTDHQSPVPEQPAAAFPAGPNPQPPSPYGQYPGAQHNGIGSNPPPYPGAQQQHFGGAPYPQGQQPKKRNTLGIIALAVAIIGAIFACIPGALIVGWILLPFGFILGLVALFISGARKGTAIGAVVVSIIGTLVGFIVFLTAVDNAVSTAFDSEVEVSSSDNSGDSASPAAALGSDTLSSAFGAEVGTRENPASIGETFSTDDWEVVVNGFNRNATSEVMAANMFNDEPPAGSQYALVNLTATYIGDESGMADFISAAWVTTDGIVIQGWDHSAVVPDPLEGELYTGASKTGNVDIAVPEGDLGLLRLDIGFVDEVFVDVG